MIKEHYIAASRIHRCLLMGRQHAMLVIISSKLRHNYQEKPGATVVKEDLTSLLHYYYAVGNLQTSLSSLGLFRKHVEKYNLSNIWNISVPRTKHRFLYTYKPAFTKTVASI